MELNQTTYLKGVAEEMSFIKITCKCGNEYKIPYSPDWDINIIALQFRCRICKRITNIPEMWYEKDERN